MRISFQLNAASPLQIKDFFRKLEVPVEPVSYTHLTLPTNREV